MLSKTKNKIKGIRHQNETTFFPKKYNKKRRSNEKKLYVKRKQNIHTTKQEVMQRKDFTAEVSGGNSTERLN